MTQHTIATKAAEKAVKTFDYLFLPIGGAPRTVEITAFTYEFQAAIDEAVKPLLEACEDAMRFGLRHKGLCALGAFPGNKCDCGVVDLRKTLLAAVAKAKGESQ